ncbi:Alpha/Beta hydrolase protein [Dactylonectria macrodidyma]|uniref:Alpha/Beta hydrolase protein n=1 Tax=Dactylonectria macrodidyma TaxID=307937 RepID=A0A9P9D1I0_9HYPO|nr:Alpha/Beta hydrolase protein [Dactylonectria macrodidyma]
MPVSARQIYLGHLFIMKGYTLFAVLGLSATTLGKQYDAYLTDLGHQKPRALHHGWDNLTVETITGTFIGMYNDTYPNVRQFLRIPFAQPPIGELRWEPPQKLPNSSRIYDSTRLGPACPQYVSAAQVFWNKYAPPNPLLNLGERRDQGSVAWSTSEDCLSLAVWTPSYANQSSQLPVALFITGGGGVIGGINVPSQLPEQWVSRSQEHIVVTINYRVNIFGNPKSRALRETSLTLLDVRAAVEWVFENIEQFGGGKDNILLWGESQGARLVDMYTMAFWEEPLVAKFALISNGPNYVINTTEVQDPYADFDIVAKSLGCDYGSDYGAELECMRQVSWVQIEEFINRYDKKPGIAFDNYIPDERYIFANKSDRYAKHLVARGPAIRSTTATELEPSPNLTHTAEVARNFNCFALADSKLRESIGLESFRYFYVGNYSNISPEPWLGAYHWTDLLMIFGTYVKMVGDIPQAEIDTSAAMQDYFLAFLKGGANVTSSVGWPAFQWKEKNGGYIVEFGRNGSLARNITGDYLDASCCNMAIPFPIFS